MRGRKPKPTAQKQLEGNPGKRRLNTTEPEFPPPAKEDEPPMELLDDTAAITEWRRLLPLMKAARVLTEADRGSLLALCQQWSRYLDASREVKKHGMVVKAPSGYPIPNPYLSIANKALQHCVKLWAELGLTPSSRSRVSTTPAPAGQGWTGRSPAAKPMTKLAELQQKAAELRRPMGVK